MKIYKGQYGWSTSAHSKDKDGNELKCYVNCQFKNGTEPLMETVEGELIFRDIYGVERKCFLSSYPSRNGVQPKLVLMEEIHHRTSDDSDLGKFGHKNNVIEEKDLPFY